MPLRLAGKTAVITAAAQGIGRATALAFAAEGATVWATDVNEPALQALAAEEPRLKTSRLDVRDPQAILAFAEQCGAVDALFNCAGFVHNGTVLQATDEEWNFALNLNVRAQFWAIQAALPRMLQNAGGAGKGSIINMASVCSSIKGLPNREAAIRYASTLAELAGLRAPDVTILA